MNPMKILLLMMDVSEAIVENGENPELVMRVILFRISTTYLMNPGKISPFLSGKNMQKTANDCVVHKEIILS